jgi:8-oxo-dGTP diphosphatase
LKLVEKAFAYITHRGRLLIFRHPNSPEVGLQVPAGTIERGELPARAVLREAREETGLVALDRGAHLGTCDFDASPYGRNEVHRRHFFQVLASGSVPETWVHLERYASDGGGPIPFEFFWAALPDGVPPLFAEHDAMIPRLIAQGPLA